MGEPPKIDWLLVLTRVFIFIIIAPLIYLSFDTILGKFFLMLYIISLIFFVIFLVSSRYRDWGERNKSSNYFVVYFVIISVIAGVISYSGKNFNFFSVLEFIFFVLVFILLHFLFILLLKNQIKN